MNEVKLKGSLYGTPTFQWVSGVRVARIWVSVNGQRLPVQCRGSVADAACRFRSGADIKVTGFLECAQVDICSWSLGIVATGLRPEGPPPLSPAVRRRRQTRRDEGWEGSIYEDHSAEFIVEVEPGLFYDPLEDEYERTYDPYWRYESAPRKNQDAEDNRLAEEEWRQERHNDMDWDDGLEDGQEWQ
jgi:hypothetical protein